MTAARTLGLMLAIVGVGTLVASVLGRAGWLIVIGIVLLLSATAASALTGVSVSSRNGELRTQPATQTAVQSTYRLGAGDMRIDLSAVRFTQSRTIEARLSAGEMTIILPKVQPVRVDTSIGAGEAQVLGHEDSGLQVRSVVTDPTSEQPSLLTLKLRVGLGSVKVERAP
jgi:predicted membrane protein